MGAFGSEIKVNTTTAYDLSYPTVTALSNGSFVVTWTAYGDSYYSSSKVYGQRYNADGTKAGAQLEISTSGSSNSVSSVAAFQTDPLS